MFLKQAHQERVTVLETEYSAKELKLQEQVKIIGIDISSQPVNV